MGGACSSHGEMRKAYTVLIGSLITWKTSAFVYNRSSISMVGGCGLDSSGSGYRLVLGFCEHGNEPSGSV
jgi:hypothetical protein